MECNDVFTEADIKSDGTIDLSRCFTPSGLIKNFSSTSSPRNVCFTWGINIRDMEYVGTI